LGTPSSGAMQGKNLRGFQKRESEGEKRNLVLYVLVKKKKSINHEGKECPS